MSLDMQDCPLSSESLQPIEESFSVYFRRKLERNPRVCIRGSIVLDISSRSLSSKSSYHEKPCYPQALVLYEVKDNETKGSNLSAAWVVFNPKTNEAECVFLRKIWHSSWQFQAMMKQIQGLVVENPARIIDTFFTDAPFIKGYLYLNALLFQNVPLPRDQLIHESLEQVSKEWCAQVAEMKQNRVKISAPISQPKVTGHDIQHAQDLGVACATLEDLLSPETGSCGIALDESRDQAIYQRYSVHADDFLNDQVTSLPETCYGGSLRVVANLTDKWAQVLPSQSHLTLKCRGNDTIVVGIHLEMGDFQKNYKTPSRVDRHAMSLIIDRKAKELELFEPNGSSPEWVPLVVDALQAFFRQPPYDQEFAGYEWIEPGSFCPLLGIQSVTKLAQCTYFSLLWVYLRISCPTIPREVWMQKLLSGGRPLIHKLITGLQCKVIRWVDARSHSFFYNFS